MTNTHHRSTREEVDQLADIVETCIQPVKAHKMKLHRATVNNQAVKGSAQQQHGGRFKKAADNSLHHNSQIPAVVPVTPVYAVYPVLVLETCGRLEPMGTDSCKCLPTQPAFASVSPHFSLPAHQQQRRRNRSTASEDPLLLGDLSEHTLCISIRAA